MIKQESTRHAGNFGEEQHDGQKNERVRDGSREDYNCLQNGYTSEQLERGRQVKKEFYRWIEDNPRAWSMGVAHLRKLASEGKRISSAMLSAYVREHDFADREGKKVRLDNTYHPLISRKLAKEYPDLKHHFEFRRSIFDLLGVE